ncbi:uracil-DNA glycosylase [Helicobacter anseris]|uniref:Uracil-DNA glycosylase n=1 Tax=Helicobacter anseris TaxID=375926 RepID=A0A3D8J313_9HELI|nr:uracil-DNA glycosylase [Helicobacter anseris]RDU71606.1 uracil-DNA glycosylase [Helicobacter anseris]
MDRILIREEWKELLKEEFSKPYFLKIKEKYIQAKKQGQIVFPPAKLTFNALNLTPPQKLKILILGQDPYHGSIFVNQQEIPQAMGLSFSVPRGVPIPPSLKNIYKELAQSIDFTPPNHGDLTKWAENGILLLNAIFSVQKGLPASHQDFGWEEFSDAIIKNISHHFEGIVFMLWGNFAKKKIPLIDSNKHTIITAPHPSPLARGFVGSGVFRDANLALQKYHKTMDWRLE